MAGVKLTGSAEAFVEISIDRCSAMLEDLSRLRIEANKRHTSIVAKIARIDDQIRAISAKHGAGTITFEECKTQQTLLLQDLIGLKIEKESCNKAIAGIVASESAIEKLKEGLIAKEQRKIEYESAKRHLEQARIDDEKASLVCAASYHTVLNIERKCTQSAVDLLASNPAPAVAASPSQTELVPAIPAAGEKTLLIPAHVTGNSIGCKCSSSINGVHCSTAASSASSTATSTSSTSSAPSATSASPPSCPVTIHGKSGVLTADSASPKVDVVGPKEGVIKIMPSVAGGIDVLVDKAIVAGLKEPIIISLYCEEIGCWKLKTECSHCKHA